MEFIFAKNQVINSQSNDTFMKYISWKKAQRINAQEFAQFVFNDINTWDDLDNLYKNCDNNYKNLFNYLCIHPKINIQYFDNLTQECYFPFNVTRLIIEIYQCKTQQTQ